MDDPPHLKINIKDASTIRSQLDELKASADGEADNVRVALTFDYPLTEECAYAIRDCGRLIQELTLLQFRESSAEGINFLASVMQSTDSLAHLRSIHLSSRWVNPHQREYVTDEDHLEDLRCPYGSEESDPHLCLMAILQAIASNPKVQEVSLERLQLTLSHFQILMNMDVTAQDEGIPLRPYCHSYLKKLEISDCETPLECFQTLIQDEVRQAPALRPKQPMCRLQHLRLHRATFNASCILQVADRLQHIFLDMEPTGISLDAARSLRNLLSSPNCTLQTMELVGPSPHVIHDIIDGIESNRSLDTLTMTEDLTLRHCTKLHHMAKHNPNLEKLTLRSLYFDRFVEGGEERSHFFQRMQFAVQLREQQYECLTSITTDFPLSHWSHILRQLLQSRRGQAYVYDLLHHRAGVLGIIHS